MKENKWINFKTISAVLMAIGCIIALSIFAMADKNLMASNMLINTSMGLISLISVFMITMVCAMDPSRADKSTVIFFIMLWLAYFGIITDNLVWGFAQRKDLLWLTAIFTVIDECVSVIMAGTIWFYQEENYPLNKSYMKTANKVVIVACILTVFYAIVGCVTGFTFYFDQNGLYCLGKGNLFLYPVPELIVLVNIILNMKRDMPKRARVIFTIFNLAPTITAIFALFWQDYAFLHIINVMILELIMGGIRMEISLKNLADEKIIAEQQYKLLENQTQIMISQIQPHFLNNALTAIYYLCGKDPKLAKKTILNFAEYFRHNMDSIRSTEPISFMDELKHTKNYLEIELLRFGDILTVEYDIKETNFRLPALSLQPIVENAVKYGIRGREEGGTVTIATEREGDKIYVSVHDDGMGFDPDGLREDGRSHVGISNTRNRLKMISGAELHIDSKIGIGTTVTMILEEQ